MHKISLGHEECSAWISGALNMITVHDPKQPGDLGLQMLLVSMVICVSTQGTCVLCEQVQGGGTHSMFCLAVATEAPSDLKNPVSLSTSYRSLQPLKNSATSFVPTYPPRNQSIHCFLNRSKQACKHVSKQASGTYITCLVLEDQAAMELQTS